jgi:hypothetical protein
VVDDRDVMEVETDSVESLAPLRFPGIGSGKAPSSIEDALQAADEACRRMEVLARDLQCLGDFGPDDGPRAA